MKLFMGNSDQNSGLANQELTSRSGNQFLIRRDEPGRRVRRR